MNHAEGRRLGVPSLRLFGDDDAVVDIHPAERRGSGELAHARNASWPCVAPCGSPISMSSLDRSTRVSRSLALSASVQARTVAISEVLMV